MRPVRKRKLVDAVCKEWDVSIRRACQVLEWRRQPTITNRAAADRPIWNALIKEIWETRVRHGYRRVHVLLRRDGWLINQEKTRRIYRELGLQLRHKSPKRRVKAKLRDDRKVRNATE